MGLWRYIALRFIQALVVLFFVSIATFVLMHAVPGDPLNAVIGERQADRPEVRAALERQYGLDQAACQCNTSTTSKICCKATWAPPSPTARTYAKN